MPETTTTPAMPDSTATPEPGDGEVEALPKRNYFSFGFAVLYLVIASVVAMAVLPPLVNVNRFKRRIVTSISTSLGRPVHLDSVKLVLLPFPGFKLTNFVVAEEPAFGSEPVIHANEVAATLRLASLYRRKVEFSRISLTEPSINLVHNEAGRWNVEGLLLKAAQISAAPTAQTYTGPDPRFPYIEATGARINVKSGLEKLPFSLTDADLALWLPRPGQWRLRLAGKPTRTDTSASDTGTVSLEGTLGKAERFDLIPVDLAAEWKNVPLGEASRVLTGDDAGIRGELRISATLHGAIGNSVLKSTLNLRGLRRADFVPEHPVNITADCQADAVDTLHALHQIRCSWPPPGEPARLALTGDVPDTHHPDSASLQLGTPGLPASALLQWLRAASPRVDPNIVATGMVSGTLSRNSDDTGREKTARPFLTGHVDVASVALSGGAVGRTPVTLGDATIASVPGALILPPMTIALGGKEPATLEGRVDATGFSLHLSGNVLVSRLMALGAAVPQFGDGLTNVLSTATNTPASSEKELPLHVDLTSARPWSGEQIWSRTAPAKPGRPGVHRRP